MILFMSKVYSTPTNFIGSPCEAIFLSQISNASFSRSLLSATFFRSSSFAIRKTCLITVPLSSASRGPVTTMPYSSPLDVSTITSSPFFISRSPGLNVYIFPARLKRTPITVCKIFTLVLYDILHPKEQALYLHSSIRIRKHSLLYHAHQSE